MFPLYLKLNQIQFHYGHACFKNSLQVNHYKKTFLKVSANFLVTEILVTHIHMNTDTTSFIANHLLHNFENKWIINKSGLHKARSFNNTL